MKNWCENKKIIKIKNVFVKNVLKTINIKMKKKTWNATKTSNEILYFYYFVAHFVVVYIDRSEQPCNIGTIHHEHGLV